MNQDELQERIGEWFADRPGVDMQLEYNQRELASRAWHWIRTPARHYTYHVCWSDEDECFIATVEEFPSLSFGAESHDVALAELKKVVATVEKDLAEERQAGMSEPRVRIRIVYRVRKGLSYITREGYDFQWDNDNGLVNITEVDEDGNPVWIFAATRLVNVEWVLLDRSRAGDRRHARPAG
jgi:predicted RNase H-like HicB family nuclease